METKRITSKLSRIKTAAFISSLGWIPGFCGLYLRRLCYKLIFRHLGQSVKIQTGLQLIDADCISFRSNVFVGRNVSIETRHESCVSIGDATFLDQDVRLSCTSGKGTITLEENVRLDRGVDIKAHGDANIIIGRNTYIGPYTCISGYGDIRIGQDCLIASHSSLYAHNYNFSDPARLIRQQGFTAKGIVIEDDCWIGSGVRVLDGAMIERGAVIGAGAVVNRNIPACMVAVGVPAKVISARTDATGKDLEVKL